MTRIRRTLSAAGALFCFSVVNSVSPASATTIIDDNCLAFGDCVVSGVFEPALVGPLRDAGIVEARTEFELVAEGDQFFGVTSLLPFDADFSIGNQLFFFMPVGNTTFVRAGEQATIQTGRNRAPNGFLGSSTFTLLVSAFDDGTILGTTASVTASSQPIPDAILAAELRDAGFAEAASRPMSEFGLDSDASFADFASFFTDQGDNGDPTGGEPPDVAAVPLPAAGWLLLAGLGGLGLAGRCRT